MQGRGKGRARGTLDAGGDPRRLLLDASLALIAEGGVGSLSLREVARRAGVTHGAPYHHFTDRGAILAAIAQEGFGLLEATMRAAIAAASHDEIARFEACGRGYVAFAAEHTAHFRVMFRPELTDAASHPEVDRAASGAFHVLVERVAACQAAGIARDLDPLPLVLTGWSTAHGLAALCIDGPLRGSASAAASLFDTDPARLAAQVGATMGALLRLTRSAQ